MGIHIPIIREDTPHTMIVKLKGEFGNFLKMTHGSAGYDLKANEDVVIYPESHVLVGTGLFIELPLNTEMQIRPRSGFSRQGVLVANSPGTIDSDYRGEIKILLYNVSEEVIKINKGDRIAQAVFHTLPIVNIEYTDELTDTERGSGGFGSTGK